MDNVVRNINIEDIIPSEISLTIEQKQEIEKQVQLIKNLGILDPILVKQKNGKYEIILGIEKYYAAKQANYTRIPVIIQENDYEIKYKNIDTKISLDSTVSDNYSTKRNKSDVVNLSELSKIKLEYERDDLKMNNEQFNNNMIGNNISQPDLNSANQGPAFGGRFFPSLEDEPTNMNMMNGGNMQPSIPNIPTPNNDLIDLTDLSVEKEAPPIPTPDFAVPAMNNSPIDQISSMNINLPEQNSFNVSGLEPQNIEPSPITPNLDNIQNNSFQTHSVPEPASMEMLNADFGAPRPMNNQFDMTPSANLNIPREQNFTDMPNMSQPDFGMVQSPINQSVYPMPTQQPMPTFSTNPTQSMDYNIGNTMSNQFEQSGVVSIKDITPVTNTIKNLATNLVEFGYKINIIENDLPNKHAIIIEVEK